MNLSKWSLSTVLFASSLACGGVEHEALDESEEALMDDEAERAAFPAANAIEAELDRLIATPRYAPLVSRVRLLAAAGCPTQITDELEVPFRCLDVRSGRHASIADVDVIQPEGVIRFHAYRAYVADQLSFLSDCPVNKSPNGIADLHASHVPKFIAAGSKKRDGVRKYDVVYRRIGDVYKLVPARPKMVTLDWILVNPAAGICVRAGE